MLPSKFYAEFNSEEKAIEYFKSAYQKKITSCKHCKQAKLRWSDRRVGWKCSSCSKFHSLKSLTFIKDSNLSLLTWLEVIYLLTETKKTLSICEITRLIKINRYKTVFYMVQKIRKVMGEVNLKAYFSKRSAIEVGIEKECDYFSVFYGKQVAGGLDFIRLEIPQYLHNRYRRMSTELRGKESFRNKKILLSRFKVYEIYPKYLRKSIESRTLYKNWERKILSNFLRELKGVFHHVSFMYLQNVLDEYCFKYNFRYGKEDKFRTLIRIASESS